MFEYVSEDLGIVYYAEDFAEVGETETEVLADEVAGETEMHGITCATYICKG